MDIYIISPLIGFTAMVAGGFWGLGGGWFVVPALLIGGIDLRIAIGASLLQMMLSTFPTVARQLKSIGWQAGGWGRNLALPLCLMAFLGGFFGKPLGNFLHNLFNNSKPQQILYLILLGFIFYKTLRGKHTESNGSQESPPPRPVKTGIIGFCSGVISSLLGIGGGTILRPIMKNFLRVPEEATAKTARLAVFITALAGTISYLSGVDSFRSGSVGYEIIFVGILLAGGGFIGFLTGARLHREVLIYGHAERAGKGFAWIVLPVFVGLVFKVINCLTVSRILVLFAGIFILSFLAYFYIDAVFLHKRRTKKGEF